MSKTATQICWIALCALGSGFTLVYPVVAQQPRTTGRTDIPSSRLEAFAAQPTAKVI